MGARNDGRGTAVGPHSHRDGSFQFVITSCSNGVFIDINGRDCLHDGMHGGNIAARVTRSKPISRAMLIALQAHERHRVSSKVEASSQPKIQSDISSDIHV